MRTNTIVKFDLESRAKDLKGLSKSYEEIAFILSNETKQTITKSSVFRYFESNHNAAVQVIEKQDKLKAKVAEAEINTIEQRIQVIEGLLRLAEEAEGEHTRVKAYQAANDALDSLDSRIGKLSPRGSTINLNNVNLNNACNLSDAELMGIITYDQEIRGC